MQRRFDLALCEGWELRALMNRLTLARRMTSDRQEQKRLELEQDAIRAEASFRVAGDQELVDEHVKKLAGVE